MSHLKVYLFGATCRTEYLLRRVIRCDSVAPNVAPNKLLGATFEVLGATFVAPDDVFCPSVFFEEAWCDEKACEDIVTNLWSVLAVL